MGEERELEIWQIVDFSFWAAIYLDNFLRGEYEDSKGEKSINQIKQWLAYLAEKYADGDMLDVNIAIALNHLIAVFLGAPTCRPLGELGERVGSLLSLFETYKANRESAEKLRGLCLTISDKFFHVEMGGNLAQVA
ncbi:MAG: hypothetical protein PHF35_02860 [Candidatus Moranbacteria bacterium]|nr:hypothetical protein [Candidatus Moranbacteria bacterium]